MSSTHPVILYDGVCGLCNRLTQFVLRRDAHATFRFAPLQSGFAATVLARHRRNPHDLDTLYVVVDHASPGERLLERSAAVAFILRRLDGGWRIGGAILGALPGWLSNAAYRAVARSRYRIFGRADACFLPPEGYQNRFLSS